jgi:hypothetical protein
MAVPEEPHDAHQAHAAIQERGSKGVAQPVRGQAASYWKTGSQLLELITVQLGPNGPASYGLKQPRTGRRSSALKLGDSLERSVVERHKAFVVQLAQGDLEELLTVVIGSDTLSLQVSKLSDAQAGPPHQVQADRQ